MAIEIGTTAMQSCSGREIALDNSSSQASGDLEPRNKVGGVGGWQGGEW